MDIIHPDFRFSLSRAPVCHFNSTNAHQPHIISEVFILPGFHEASMIVCNKHLGMASFENGGIARLWCILKRRHCLSETCFLNNFTLFLLSQPSCLDNLAGIKIKFTRGDQILLKRRWYQSPKFTSQAFSDQKVFFCIKDYGFWWKSRCSLNNW